VTLRVTLIGVTGRMGQALLAALPQFPQLTLQAAVTNEGHPDVGGVVQGVTISTDLPAALQGADVAVDFSSAAVASEHLQACANAGVPLLMGTTGLPAELQAQIDAAALRIPVIVAANTSLALNVLLALVRRAAAALPADYDIEIFEAHHRHKVDAPSGTALALGRAAADGRGISLPQAIAPTGAEPGPRAPGSIGFAVARGGDVVGEHDVRFLGQGEQLHLGHVATDRGIFARGALTGALWLAGQPPGRYEMSDVLSINT
jgi:4-hydroxy-tetrahydrodipicolinate reductase